MSGIHSQQESASRFWLAQNFIRSMVRRRVTLGELGRVQMVGIKPSGVPLTEGEFSNSTDGWASSDLSAHHIRERYGCGSRPLVSTTLPPPNMDRDSSNCPHPGQLQKGRIPHL